MKTLAFALVLLGLLVLASAHGSDSNRHHGAHHGGPQHEAQKGSHHQVCQYKDSKGHHFDLSRLSQQDLIVKDMVSGSSFHYSACGPVHSQACPAGSAVCEITNKGAAISYGLANDAHWADRVEAGSSLEVIYGGGERCSDGEARKAVVEMRCLPTGNPNSGASYLIGLMKEECVIKLIVESAHACDKEVLCSAIMSEDVCQANADLCDWSAGRCVASMGTHYKWNSHKTIVMFAVSALIGFTAVVCLGCAAFCVCLACRRAVKRRHLRRSLPTHKSKKAAAAAKKAAAKNPEEEMSLITPEATLDAGIQQPFAPFPVVIQQADGTFVQVPMSFPGGGMVPHGYSMVQYMPVYHSGPAPEQQQQQQQA